MESNLVGFEIPTTFQDTQDNGRVSEELDGFVFVVVVLEVTEGHTDGPSFALVVGAFLERLIQAYCRIGEVDDGASPTGTGVGVGRSVGVDSHAVLRKRNEKAREFFFFFQLFLFNISVARGEGRGEKGDDSAASPCFVKPSSHFLVRFPNSPVEV
jgi:hypothetical protein